MKKLSILLFILFSLESTANSYSSDSTKQSFLNNFNLNFAWFEVGSVIPIKENSLNNLPYGMDKYLSNTKAGFSASTFNIELWYKNKIGLELLLISYYDFGYNKTSFDNYISNQYPNFYIKNGWNNGFSSGGLGYRINYKIKLKKFQIIPKFQIGINNYNSSDDHRSFKEKGSNHIIEYSIEKKSLKKNIIDYHFIVDFSKSVNFMIPFEIGVKTEFITSPTLYQYTITEKPYSSPPKINQLTVKQNNPAWVIGLVFRVILIK